MLATSQHFSTRYQFYKLFLCLSLVSELVWCGIVAAGLVEMVSMGSIMVPLIAIQGITLLLVVLSMITCCPKNEKAEE